MNNEIFEIPLERINPEILHKMIEGFVTREWSEHADSTYTLEEKVTQVRHQRDDKQAKIMCGPGSESWNIIPIR